MVKIDASGTLADQYQVGVGGPKVAKPTTATNQIDLTNTDASKGVSIDFSRTSELRKISTGNTDIDLRFHQLTAVLTILDA